MRLHSSFANGCFDQPLLDCVWPPGTGAARALSRTEIVKLCLFQVRLIDLTIKKMDNMKVEGGAFPNWLARQAEKVLEKKRAKLNKSIRKYALEEVNSKPWTVDLPCDSW